MRHIDRREQRERFNGEDERRRERPHQRKPVGRAHRHVNQGDRPGQKHEDFEQISYAGSDRARGPEPIEKRFVK